jgi:hypothetical protein
VLSCTYRGRALVRVTSVTVTDRLNPSLSDVHGTEMARQPVSLNALPLAAIADLGCRVRPPSRVIT